MTRDEFNELLALAQEIEEGIFATKNVDTYEVAKIWVQCPDIGPNTTNFPLHWMYTVRRKVLQNLVQCYYLSWPIEQNPVELKKFICDLCEAEIFCVETDDALDIPIKKALHSVAFFSETDAVVAMGLIGNYKLDPTIS